MRKKEGKKQKKTWILFTVKNGLLLEMLSDVWIVLSLYSFDDFGMCFSHNNVRNWII